MTDQAAQITVKLARGYVFELPPSKDKDVPFSYSINSAGTILLPSQFAAAWFKRNAKLRYVTEGLISRAEG